MYIYIYIYIYREREWSAEAAPYISGYMCGIGCSQHRAVWKRSHENGVVSV